MASTKRSDRIPSSFAACFGQDQAWKRRAQVLDPVVIQEQTGRALAAARRLLEHEQYVERAGAMAAGDPLLASTVDDNIARATERAFEDAKELARGTLDFYGELHRAGMFRDRNPAYVRCFDGTTLTSDQIFGEALPALQPFLAERGFPPELLAWASERAPLGGITISRSGDELVATRGDVRIVLGSDETSGRPVLDGRSFVDGRNHRRLQRVKPDGAAARSTPHGGIVGLLKGVLDHYEGRVRGNAGETRALTEEVAVGFIVAIILFVLWIGSGVVVLFCTFGWIRDQTVCWIAELVFRVGAFIACVIALMLSGGGGSCEFEFL